MLSLGAGAPAVIQATVALEDVHALLDPWPWPRWFGPVVVVAGQEAVGGLDPGTEALIRPVVPLLRIPRQPSRANWAMAELRLTLALSAPPKGGWPPWLVVGLERLVAAKADLRLISPDRMLQLREAAGPDGITQLLTSPHADPDLAQAVTALLMHPRHRAHLGSALDLLRNGADSLAALRIAYQLTPSGLASGR